MVYPRRRQPICPGSSAATSLPQVQHSLVFERAACCQPSCSGQGPGESRRLFRTPTLPKSKRRRRSSGLPPVRSREDTDPRLYTSICEHKQAKYCTARTFLYSQLTWQLLRPERVDNRDIPHMPPICHADGRHDSRSPARGRATTLP